MKRKYLSVAGLALTFAVTSGAANALMLCREPSAPSCVSGYYEFNDQYAFDSCKSDVESYLSDVSDYRSCLIDASNDAAEQANEVIEDFNCKAEGNSFCP